MKRTRVLALAGRTLAGVGLLALPWVVATAAPAAADVVVYGPEDFTGGAGPEWSQTTTTTLPLNGGGDDTFLGGPFGNTTETLTLSGLQQHQNVRLQFDLYILKEWTGNEGPDLWTLVLNGSLVAATTFDNGCGTGQSHPDPYLTDHPARTGEDAALANRFFGTGCEGDSVYHMDFLMGTAASTYTADFSGTLLEGWPTDGWGIDNVTVTLGGVPPDYVVSAVGDPPASASPGDTGILVPVTTTNIGQESPGPIRTSAYLSLDDSLGGGDVRVGGVNDGTLDPGESAARTFDLKIRPVASGDYYLLACADPTDGVAESDESNNCRASQSTIHIEGPDLVVSSASEPPPTGGPGDDVPMEVVTRNDGGATAGPSTTIVYFSRKPRPTPSMYPFGVFSVPSLDAATSDTQSTTLTVPSLAPGTYYVVACADAGKVVVETLEKNNCTVSASPIVIT